MTICLICQAVESYSAPQAVLLLHPAPLTQNRAASQAADTTSKITYTGESRAFSGPPRAC